ncbi:hypothetical protein [Emticicia sp. TH156]|uniref:hypothetical protein n=1 Tax=Emticicia sp. TH156 TaxID=2067454 RepID=UPI000C77BC28|nr:hypothetical protein [Emticicia sp. TH156]PLK45935.1 hypothetical protein C0V77_00840 [Emticicia sp. TH156]
MNSFEHIETIDDAIFTEQTLSLKVNERQSPKLILIRGLIGSIKIKHNLYESEFEQSLDYFDLLKTKTHIPPLERLTEYLGGELSIEELGDIFKNRRFLKQNQQFFYKLNNEFSNFFYYENKESHTTAFAFLYRILETISYAFPLIYASKSNDFKGTYSFLKDCLSGNKDKGELGFFKSFIKTIFSEDPLYESSITINIIADNEEIQGLLFRAFDKICIDKNIFSPTDTVEPRSISIKFAEYSSFIINLRNRFFHLFNSGQPNLQSDDILDADYFFKLVNKQTAYWLSIVLIEILKYSIEKCED